MILVQRYKELFKGTRIEGGLPYDIDTHIIEIQTDSIDDDYMNSKFKLFMINLNKGDAVAKEKAIHDLHKSFASLTQEEQKLAKLFLNDIETGKIAVESGKTFRDYITLYMCNAHNDQIHRLASGLGIDEAKLRALINLHVDESNINAYGRYDELMNTIDIDDARNFLGKRLKIELSKRQARIEADKLLRRFIFEGGFNIE